MRFFLLALALPAFGGSVQGIHNFYKVDEHVYRGAQPTDEGFQYLAKIGVKTVIDLRGASEGRRNEESVVTAAGMKYINIPMTGLTPPSEAEITKILGMLEDGTAGPVFVHCQRGADRTGAVIASYRIEHDRMGQRSRAEGSDGQWHELLPDPAAELHPQLPTAEHGSQERRNQDRRSKDR